MATQNKAEVEKRSKAAAWPSSAGTKYYQLTEEERRKS